jgi:hypothetical protein
VRALVIHVGEGSTHVLLATTRRADLSADTPRPTLLDPHVQEEEHHDRLFVMHDQWLRNGADLSLRYLDHIQEDLREALLRQAAEAILHFRDMADAVTVALSASLLAPGIRLEEDPLVAAFQSQLGLAIRVLTPQDEALWILRGVRGIYPSGELGCVAPGLWRSHGAWEEPGRAPLLLHWPLGASRMPDLQDTGDVRQLPGLRAPRDQPLYLTGGHGWLLGALQLGLTFHDPELLDEAELDLHALKRLEELLLGLSVAERNLIPMVAQQGDSLPDALALARRMLQESGATRLRLCHRGLTHGLASHQFYEGRKTATPA